MKETKNYGSLLKATSIFGGVQVINILIQLVRSKVVAVLLGPAGMGIMGLLQTTINLITASTSFGLSTSAIRDISEAHSSGNKNKISLTISIVRKLFWLTGLLGLIVTIVLSPLLSQMTFGNYDYTIPFVFLSVILLLTQLASGQRVLLQGMRKIKWLAKANIYSSLFGVLLSLPLFYFYGEHGIVPALVVNALVILLVQYFFSKRIQIEKTVLSLKSAILQGQEMIKLGFMLSLTGLIAIISSYLIRIFISNSGGIEDVGLYSAGFTMINTYVGMVFTAMSTDFFPRLSGTINDLKKSNQLVNEQGEITLIILPTLLVAFIIFADLFIQILFSAQFLEISEMIKWATLGIYFKAAAFPLGYLILAKGDSNLFFKKETVIHIVILLLNIIGYKLYGLKGLGISFLIGYFINFVIIYSISYLKYKVRYSNDFLKIFILQLLFGIISFTVAMYTTPIWKIILGLGLLALTGSYAIYEMNKRMNIRDIIDKFRKK